jgi:hypothetical protein
MGWCEARGERAGYTFIDQVDAHCPTCISAYSVAEENFLYVGDGVNIENELSILRRLVVNSRIPGVVLQSFRDRARAIDLSSPA